MIASCDIAGSSDSSIRNVVPNDLAYIIGRSRITRIYANGAKSKQLYDKYLAKKLGIEAVQLPSTSPANAAYSVERLLEYWQKNNKDTREREVEYACIYRRKEVYKDFMYIEGMCQRIKIMCSDSEKNMSAFADQNHAPSLTCVRLDFTV